LEPDFERPAEEVLGQRLPYAPGEVSDGFLRLGIAPRVLRACRRVVEARPVQEPHCRAQVKWTPKRRSVAVCRSIRRQPPRAFPRAGGARPELPLRHRLLPAHRPLGNQSRARRRMYLELSRLRQEMNRTPHVEPTGEERFE
jgi:hypothetical protein